MKLLRGFFITCWLSWQSGTGESAVCRSTGGSSMHQPNQIFRLLRHSNGYEDSADGGAIWSVSACHFAARFFSRFSTGAFFCAANRQQCQQTNTFIRCCCLTGGQPPMNICRPKPTDIRRPGKVFEVLVIGGNEGGFINLHTGRNLVVKRIKQLNGKLVARCRIQPVPPAR